MKPAKFSKKRVRRTENNKVLNTDNKPDTADEKSYACFKVGREQYAMDLDAIIEVLHQFDITHVPHLPDTFSGIIHLRGESVPVLYLSTVLQEEHHDSDEKTCLVTVIDQRKMGFLIDSDIEIKTSNDGITHPLPDCYSTEEATFLRGIFVLDNEFFGILDPKGVVEILAEWREDYAKA